MRVLFHPDFSKDIRRFTSDYTAISAGLGQRFRDEVLSGIDAIKQSPGSAGHYVNTGTKVVREFRRRNMRAFPFFILYGVHDDLLIVGALIPSRSDPLTWLARFESPLT